MIDSHLLAFLLGFFVCAVGIILAMLFDTNLSMLEKLYRKFFRR